LSVGVEAVGDLLKDVQIALR